MENFTPEQVAPALALFQLADKFQELKERKSELEDLLKQLSGEIEQTNSQMIAAMDEQGLRNFTRNGKQFGWKHDLYASPLAEAKEQVFTLLKQHGFGDLVRETVPAQSFAAFIKEQLGDYKDILDSDGTDLLADFGDELEGLSDHEKDRLKLSLSLPEWLQGLVNLAPKKSVTMRKAGK